MNLAPDIRSVIANASAKALASYGPAGLNVVPVSTVRVNIESVWLFNFFMDKTVRNIAEAPTVALACWDDLTGIQLRATAEYFTKGKVFTEAAAWVAPKHPDRTLRGVLVLTPTACYDVTADLKKAGSLIAGDE